MSIMKVLFNLAKTKSGINWQANMPCNSGDCLSDTSGLVVVLSWAYGVISVCAIIVIVIAGIQMASSAGNPGKVQRAKDAIFYAVIGLIVATLAAAIIAFVSGVFK